MASQRQRNGLAAIGQSARKGVLFDDLNKTMGSLMHAELGKSQFAMPPGVPYQEFFRRAAAAHHALMSGDESLATQVFPDAVVADLDRLRTRADPRTRQSVRVDHSGLEERRRACNLSRWWPDVAAKFQVAGHRRVLVALDGDGIVLERAGDPKSLDEVRLFGLTDGADWRCAESGTNGVRISHQLRQPFHIAGPGWIQVEGPTVSWREPLNRCKAEILLVLAALGPRTRTELRADLYVEGEQEAADSTLRSRLTRLRQPFGSLLTRENTRDMYARVIDADVLYPADRTQLLPCSTAPAVRRLAQS
jgi:hypothetical protein